MATVAAPRNAATGSNNGPTHPFTCNTCQVAFRGSDLQRTHMQSDWHRYNLKRRVASLPPLTSEVFAEKVIANQASAAATAAKASYEKICAPCQRTYYSQNAYENHLGSQKHKAKVAQLGTDSASMSVTDDASSMMSSTFSLGEPLERPPRELAHAAAEDEFAEVVDGIKKATIDDVNVDFHQSSRPHNSASAEIRREHPISPNRSSAAATPTPSSITLASQNEPDLHCLFCNLRSESLESNVKHMETVHSMFIPERSYLVDLKGLIGYLHDRIFALHECLYCGSIRNSAQGAQTHMRDKGHCMIAFESENEMVEVGEFYDFRGSYSDEESEEEEEDELASQRRGMKLGAKREAGTEMDDDEDDEEWEDDSEDMSDEQGDDNPKDRPIRAGPRPAAYFDDYELHLPSGRTAGHRSLARYFRQNLHNYPTPAERESRRMIENGAERGSDDEQESSNLRQRGRQLISRGDGGLGLLSAPEGKKREARAIELKEQKRQQRAETRYKWGNERRNNFQKHFRDPLLQ